ncbi:uncharacterized protein BHQ10_007516 [Talaromyces amestolkiae]|uniref:Protein kinase domain-containing protein n=1 Tax=Talaromyces amestolkiae TaxID=1196081 RepID=A0A364L6R7_TALAM|nr:uncharacterized protein BHQ10_007516 [Talaromyces amestolkiae]RAO71504.1 hypothetical protein BHQ10_007516 [Talaromyces amestolkiae]
MTAIDLDAGTLYQGTHVETRETVSIKLERVDAAHPQLEHEANVHNRLAHIVGIPFVRWFGTDDNHRVMVMNHLGPNLEELLQQCDGTFTLRTVLSLADQLIPLIESFHSERYIHRDIRPESIFVGSGIHDPQVYLTNLGLAKRYCDPKSGAHIAESEGKALVGTVYYASLHVHDGKGHARRDDMESLGFVLLRLMRGSLPWQRTRCKKKDKMYRDIGEKKANIEVLCHRLPSAFGEYFTHVRSLKFHDKPDYSYLRKIFRDLFVDKSFQRNYSFDWRIYHTWATMSSKREDAKESAPCSNTVVPSLQQIPNPESVVLQAFDQVMTTKAEDEKAPASRSNPVVLSLQQIPNPESAVLLALDQTMTETRSRTVALSLQQMPNLSSVAQLFEPASGGICLQPNTPPITKEQLDHELTAIYDALFVVERKCIEIVKQQNENPDKFTPLQLQVLAALFRMVLYKFVDFFLVSNHPAASDAQKGLAKAYSMPVRMWRHGIQPFLDLLRKELPLSRNYLLAFLYMAYAIMTLLLESVPQFEETWIELLGDLARYKMGIEKADMREIYTRVARYWYTKAADLNPDIGRIPHHLAVLAWPNVLQQLFYYSKSLISVQPFTNARGTILYFFEQLLDPVHAVTNYPKHNTKVLISFVKAHGVLFKRQNVSTFLSLANEFLSQLDQYASEVGPLFREQGVYITASNYAALFDYGSNDAAILASFNRARLTQGTKAAILKKAYMSWQKPSCQQPGIDLRVIKDGSIGSSGEVGSLACDLAFTTLSMILGRLDDPNTMPSVHISLVLLWCLAMVPESMSRIQADVPWERLATYLTTLVSSDTDLLKIGDTEFPVQNLEFLQELPEDLVINGITWARLYYPPGFFSKAREGGKRPIGHQSENGERTQRCVRLGMRIAKFDCWIVYDVEQRKFSPTKFACELAALSEKHQLLHRHIIQHLDLLICTLFW